MNEKKKAVSDSASIIVKRANKLLNKGFVNVTTTFRVDRRTANALERLKNLNKDALTEVLSDALTAYNIPAVVEAYEKMHQTGENSNA